MRILQVFVLQIMACASLLACAHEEIDLQNSSHPFNQGIYDKLFQSGEELPQGMRRDRQKNARTFAKRRRPAFDDASLSSLVQVTDQHASSPLRAKQQVFVDTKGRPWYVIDRSQSDVLRRTTAVLKEPNPDEQPLTMEHFSVVRCYAFDRPSYYGWMYIIRNNAYVGKSMLFELALYPIRSSDSVGPEKQ